MKMLAIAVLAISYVYMLNHRSVEPVEYSNPSPNVLCIKSESRGMNCKEMTFVEGMVGR